MMEMLGRQKNHDYNRLQIPRQLLIIMSAQRMYYGTRDDHTTTLYEMKYNETNSFQWQYI